MWGPGREGNKCVTSAYYRLHWCIACWSAPSERFPSHLGVQVPNSRRMLLGGYKLHQCSLGTRLPSKQCGTGDNLHKVIKQWADRCVWLENVSSIEPQAASYKAVTSGRATIIYFSCRPPSFFSDSGSDLQGLVPLPCNMG